MRNGDPMKKVSSWGRLGAAPHDVVSLHDPRETARLIASGTPGAAYGMGRSYGDVCLNPDGVLWLTTGLDHLIGFDDASGRLVCEAGVLLRDIQRLAIPRGWMLPVTPGTQMVTVGGAIANDVHGKNHHRLGTFGEHVRSLTLLRTDGEVIRCGPDERPDWFAATVGGLGLTGLVTQAEIQLRRVDGPWLDTETLPFAGLEAFCDINDSSEVDWEHTVSWIDSTSRKERGLFMRGNPARAGQVPPSRGGPLAIPAVLPVSLLHPASIRPINMLYYQLNKRRTGRVLAHYEPFFYPLDNLQNWNYLYGPKGFFQYQNVVPRAAGLDAVRAMLGEITRAGEASSLAVLKTFGDRPPVGMLSFPQAGFTLALDFPNRGERTIRLLERLDAVVREAGGRIYPAKDARMPRELFEAGYPRLPEFMHYRDPGISTGLSRRLMGR